MTANKAGIHGFTLKSIAILSMLTDHVGAVLYPDIILFRVIGRIAFPIFVFLLVEGFYHTGNIRKYEIRMCLFAFLSEIPFDLAFSETLIDSGSQNVFFTLAIGLIMMDLLRRFPNCYQQIIIAAACMLGAEFLSADYGFGGVLIIFLFYEFRKKTRIRFVGMALISFLGYGTIELASLLAFIPIFLYNGKRGPSLKYVFYIFYPAHLLVLYAISQSWIHGAETVLLGGTRF